VWRSASRHSCRGDAGFTLLEALIGLAIAGLGLVAIIEAAGTGLGSASIAGAYVEAARHAQAHLDAVGTVIPLAAGERNGDDGSGFTWTTRITVTGMQAPRQGQGPGMTLYRIDATETTPGLLARRTVTLTTLRVGDSSGAAAAQ
jgi:prepilin-type N-terminal cleavage/methylation domain-containing protein